MGRLMEMSRGSDGKVVAQAAYGVEAIYTSAVTWGGVRTGVLDDERADKKARTRNIKEKEQDPRRGTWVRVGLGKELKRG